MIIYINATVPFAMQTSHVLMAVFMMLNFIERVQNKSLPRIVYKVSMFLNLAFQTSSQQN